MRIVFTQAGTGGPDGTVHCQPAGTRSPARRTLAAPKGGDR